MEDLIEHWSRLRYTIQGVEGATLHNISDRLKEMEQERVLFDKLFTKFALKHIASESDPCPSTP